MPEFDVVGMGLNATDTMILIPHFPAYGGKVPFLEEIWSPGGQVASAIVACSVSVCVPSTSARSVTTSAAASRPRACAARG